MKTSSHRATEPQSHRATEPQSHKPKALPNTRRLHWLSLVGCLLVAPSVFGVWVPELGATKEVGSGGPPVDSWVAVAALGESPANPPQPDYWRSTNEEDAPIGDYAWYTTFKDALEAGYLQEVVAVLNYRCDGGETSLSPGFYSTGDSDGDGIPNEADTYPLDSTNNSVDFNGSVPHQISAIGCYLTQDPSDSSFQWLPYNDLYNSNPPPPFYGWVAATDSDSDGLPDQVDPFVADATNNTHEWEGGMAAVDGVMHRFRAQAIVGDGSSTSGIVCTNGKALPDVLRDEFLVELSSLTVLHWDGGSVWLNGALNTFPPCNYVAEHISNLIDSDGDEVNDSYLGTDGDIYPASGSRRHLE
jgi:hypothetical protein